MASDRLAECAQQQRDEIEILQSIFHDQEITVSKVTCKKYGGQTWLVRLALTPPVYGASQSGISSQAVNTVFASIELHIRFSAKYPDEIPKISLKNAKGLSSEQMNALEQQCTKIANGALGEAMCMQLAEAVRTYLGEHNRPPIGSFYEQMNARIARERELAAETQRRTAEEQKREAELFYESVRSALNGDESDGESAGGGTHELACTERTHRQVRIGSLLTVTAASDRGRLEPVGVVALRCDVQTRSGRAHRLRAFELAGGRFALLTEWHVPVVSGACEQLALCSGESLRHFVASLRPLLAISHENLLSYVGVGVNTRFRALSADVQGEIVQDDDAGDCEGSSCRFYVLQETTNGFVSVREHLVDMHCGAPRPFLRAYTRQLISAYAFLHSHALRVGSIRPANVLVRNEQLRVSDYSLNANVPRLFRRGADLVELGSLCKLDSTQLSSAGSRAADINRLAQLVVTMATGSDFCAAHESAAMRVSDIPESITTQLRLFVVELLALTANTNTNTNSNVDLTTLLKHAFFSVNETENESDNRTRGKKVCFGVPAQPVAADGTKERGRRNSDSAESRSHSDEDSEKRHAANHGALGSVPLQSRFDADYEAIQVIGKGGFGAVVQARHRLDGQMYAVKRICMVGGRVRFDEKVRREVRLLSRLNHENVVRYYNAWLEDAFDPVSGSESNSYSTMPHTPCRTSPTKSGSPDGKLKGRTKTISTSSPEEPVTKRGGNLTRQLNALGLPEDDIEANAPPPVSQDVEISICVGDDSSDSDDDDDPDSDSQSESDSEQAADSSSDLFVRPRTAAESDETETSEPPTTEEPSPKPAAKPALITQTSVTRPAYLSRTKLLYIQMEYCEKRTLSSAIEEGRLVDNPDRVWKMLREIAEGLNYVHEQGIIHRDLKPGNIFIDSLDHVKIGDFGLATIANALQKARKPDVDPAAIVDAVADQRVQPVKAAGSSPAGATGSDLTTQVGTKLYIAPEVLTVSPVPKTSKARYDQKVDMFSLGVILFEMCVPPFRTHMHRIEALVTIRGEPASAASLISSTMCAPPQSAAAMSSGTPVQQLTLPALIQALLSHNPAARPSSADLVARLPLAESTKRERELLAFVKNGGSIRVLMETLFERSTPKVHQVGFDADADELHAAGAAPSFPSRADSRTTCSFVLDRALLLAGLAATCRQIFALHGYVELGTPFLMLNDVAPVQLATAGHSRALFIDRLGRTVTLPYDLRTRFVRFVANNATLTDLRRFDIGRVYRERKVPGLHPHECLECAYDYVLRSPSQLSANVVSFYEAETMQLVFEVLQALPALRDKYEVVLSHSDLLRAVLLYHGVPESKLEQVQDMISQSRTSVIDTQFVLAITKHCEQKPSDQALQELRSFLCLDDSLANVASTMKRMVNAKQALAHLGILVAFLTECLDVRVPIRVRVIINLGSAYSSRIAVCDRGVQFRVLATLSEAAEKDKRGAKLRKDAVGEVLHSDRVVAMGCHYETLVAGYERDYSLFDSVRPTAKSTTKPIADSDSAFVTPTHLFAFGVTMYFDRLVDQVGQSFVNAWSKVALLQRGSAPTSYFRLHRYDVLLAADAQRDRDESSRAIDTANPGRFATKAVLSEVLRYSTRLWDAGYRVRVAATCWSEHLPLSATHGDAPTQYSTVILFSATDYDNVRLRSVFRKDGELVNMSGREYREGKVPKSTLVDYVKQLMPGFASPPSGNPFTKHLMPLTHVTRTSESCNSSSNLPLSQATQPLGTTTQATVNNAGVLTASLSASRLNVSFAFEDRRSAHDKRRLEGQVLSRLNIAVTSLSAKARVEVLCVSLLKDVLKSVAAYLELGTEEDFDASLKIIYEKHQRARAYLANVADEIRRLRFDKNCNVLVLYSVKDDYFKLLFC